MPHPVYREFDAYLKTQGIKRRLTVPHTPQQNGIAERKNRTLVEMARYVMRQAGSLAAYCAEAINAACYMRNRCTTSTLKGGISFKLWKNKTPTVNYMKVFVSKVYMLDKNPQKSKFSSRSEQGIFMGYLTECKTYRVYE